MTFTINNIAICTLKCNNSTLPTLGLCLTEVTLVYLNQYEEISNNNITSDCFAN
jgi:hypothetical protein